MTAPWGPVRRALAALDGNRPAVVRRLEARHDGPLLVEVERDSRVSWFRIDGEVCRECPAEGDELLPLGARLAELRAGAEVSVLSHRPGRRLVLRVDDGSRVVILKGYRGRRLAGAALRHRRAAQALRDGPLRVPRLLDVDEERACLVIEAVPGRPLELGRNGSDVFFRVGAGLRLLQERGCTEGLPDHGPADELDVVDGLGRAVRRIGLELPAAWSSVRARLVPAGVQDGTHLLAHRDLHDRQLLASEHVVLLDFDLLCTADPLLDAANVLAHLKLREWQGVGGADSEGTVRCGRALLDGLDRDAERGFARRLRFYQATTLLRLALVYAMRPRWAHLVDDLVDLSRRCAEEC